ncbi:MAG: heme-binding beta-barrel domain-containing protein [Acidimicrobiia bacterium]
MTVPGAADQYGSDIYTEAEGDDDTLARLGPLAALAGVWTSAAGADVHPVGPGSDITGPVVDGDEHNDFVERYELQPTDPQTNGPQLFYGLRYHTHIVKPGEVETFHDQVGYWLWEPAAHTVLLSLAIPRGQVVLAGGPAEPDATEFEVRAELGSEAYGILSNPFLGRAFRTVSFRMRVTAHPDGSWSYEEHTMMRVPGREGLVDHVDRNTLRRVGDPTPNPLAAAATDLGRDRVGHA